MSREKYKIEKDDLIRLYFKEKKSFSEIGKIYGCKAQIICLRFKKYDLKARTVSEALKGREHTWGYKIGNSLRGKKHPCVWGPRPNSVPWNKDKTKSEYPELFKNCNRKLSKEHQLALIRGQKRVYNKLEQIVGNSHGSLYFTGNRHLWLTFNNNTQKNPDFVVAAMDGTYFNIAIEVFGNYWHKGNDSEELVQKYNEIGWRCLVLWEDEINKLNNSGMLFDKIDRFINYDIYEPCVCPQDDDYGICLHLLSDEIKDGLI